MMQKLLEPELKEFGKYQGETIHVKIEDSSFDGTVKYIALEIIKNLKVKNKKLKKARVLILSNMIQEVTISGQNFEKGYLMGAVD